MGNRRWSAYTQAVYSLIVKSRGTQQQQMDLLEHVKVV